MMRTTVSPTSPIGDRIAGSGLDDFENQILVELSVTAFLTAQATGVSLTADCGFPNP
jgi:hypothetical protein